MDTTLDGVTGDWGPGTWGDAGGFLPPNGPQVQASDVLTNTTVSAGQDTWSGTLRNLLSTATGYVLQKDAIKSGLTPVPVRTANGQAYVPANSAAAASSGLGANPMTWVVVGVAVFAAIAIATHGKG